MTENWLALLSITFMALGCLFFIFEMVGSILAIRRYKAADKRGDELLDIQGQHLVLMEKSRSESVREMLIEAVNAEVEKLVKSNSEIVKLQIEHARRNLAGELENQSLNNLDKNE